MKTPDPSAAAFQVTYLDHFTLIEKPFGATPDPDFFFESRSHSEAIQRLEAYLKEREGLALIYGDVGTGKTLVCRRLFNGLDRSDFNAVLITNPVMDGTELLFEIAAQLNVAPGDASTRETMIRTLKGFLTVELKEGRTSVVAIDEAQLLSNDALTLLLELSRRETDDDAALRIILFGQQDLATRLLDRSVAHLRRHVTVTHYLQPLSPEEVGGYVKYRLSRVDSKKAISFTEEALDGLFDASGGCPRVIKRLCDRSLLLLSRQPGTVVDRKILNMAIESEAGASSTVPKRFKLPVGIYYKVVLILAATLIFCGLFLFHRHTREIAPHAHRNGDVYNFTENKFDRSCVILFI
jgi:type II secretory pathway predicted ATPase ExeA